MADETNPITENSAAWWDFDTATVPSAWRAQDATILDGLKQHVPSTTDRRPWQPGYELHIRGQGGLVAKERRHYTILGHGRYSNYIAGSRKLAADSQSIETGHNVSVQVARDDDAPESEQTEDTESVSWGRDSLTVNGNADIKFGSRTAMMSGTITRNWNGGVMRLASMEGVICGGAFLRVIASPSATLSALMSGDVYGGIARVSAVRTYLAVLQYRACKAGAWASGLYLRNATFVIEPIMSTPSAGGPVSKIAAKLARLGRTMEVARMLCPVLDILVGIVTIFPMGIYALGKLIQGLARGKRAANPPMGPPRIRTRTCGLSNETFASMTIM